MLSALRSLMDQTPGQTAENRFDDCVEIGLVQRTVFIDVPVAWSRYSRSQY